MHDDRLMFFVAIALRHGPAEAVAPLFHLLIRAAVYEVDPSRNRWFVEPCVNGVGANETAEALLRYFREGSDFEKAGAANAMYWARAFGRMRGPGGLRRLYLEEFLHNTNVDVRRSLVAQISLGRLGDSRGERDLVMQARNVALAHDDDYIRGRAEGDIGETREDSRLYSPLPDREQPGAEGSG